MNVLRQEIRTGLLIVVTVLTLLGATLYLGAPGVFIPQKTFFIYVDNAGGIREGADVAVAGRKIGQVIKLWSPIPENKRPDPKKETMIEVKVARKAEIYRQVKVMITSNGLLGEYFLDFTSGQESSGLAQDRATFIGEKAPGISDAVPVVLAKLDPVLKTTTATLDTLQKTAENLTRLTAPDGEVTKALREFREVGGNFGRLSAAGGPLHKTLDNVAQLTGEGGKLSIVLEQLDEITAKAGPLQQALHNAAKLTADLANNDDLRFTLRNSREATSELAGALGDIRGKLTVMADNLEQGSDTLKREPWRLIWPATKKYPEAAPTRAGSVKAKVGGRRRPVTE